MNTRIKELRLSKGLSQLALAMKVGCSQNTISRIELGLSKPNSTILLNIAAYFNTSVDYLLFKTNQKEILPPMDTACARRIDEYVRKLKLLPRKEQDAIFVLIERCSISHQNER